MASDRTEAADPPWNRTDRLSFGILLAVVFAGLLGLVHPWYDPMNDASIYITTARALLDGEGYTHLGIPFAVRPPGFSVMLLPVMAATGGNFHAMNLFVALFGAGTVLLVFLLARPRLGGVLALLTALLIGTNPSFVRLSSQVMSDVPGAFFILLALWIARQFERDPSIAKDIALGVVIGLSVYVRVVCILVLPAVLLARACRLLEARPSASDWAAFTLRRCVPLGVVTVAVFAPWVVRNGAIEADPPVDQFLNHSYVTGLLHVDKGDPTSPRLDAEAWKARLTKRVGQLSAAFATRFEYSNPTPARMIVAAIVFAIFLARLVTTRSAPGFFILGSLVIMVSYYSFQDRFLIPIFVLLVPGVVEAVYRGLNARFGVRVATGTLAVVLVGIIVTDFSPRHRWESIEEEHDRMMRVARTVNGELPADARLASEIGFHYAMYLDRPVHSLRWSYRHAPGVAGREAVIDRYGIDTVLLDPRRRRDHEVLLGFVEDYGEGRALAGLRVLRVRE